VNQAVSHCGHDAAVPRGQDHRLPGVRDRLTSRWAGSCDSALSCVRLLS
jgi:hypothetical protein